MSDQYVGEIRMVGFNFAPVGWAFCFGQLMSISQNQALFALLGTTFGGDGVSTFGLPDLRSRTPVGQGQGLGLSNMTIGEQGGTEQVSLLVSNLPSHTHTATFTPSGGSNPTVTVNIQAGNQPAQATTPSTPYLAATTPTSGHATGTPLYASSAGSNPPNLAGVSASISGAIGGGTVTNALTGGSSPVSLRNPFLVINFIIALQGVFPSRN